MRRLTKIWKRAQGFCLEFLGWLILAAFVALGVFMFVIDVMARFRLAFGSFK